MRSRTRLLTPAAWALIEKMVKASRADDDEGAELVWEKGAGWWHGTRRHAAATCDQLQALCLIRMDQGCQTGEFERYQPNEDAEGLVDAPATYIPRVMRPPDRPSFTVEGIPACAPFCSCSEKSEKDD